MLDWLIIGGGIHGTHLSRVLTANTPAGAASVRVLDPHLEPLQRWRECTRNCGMEFLRSPLEDHLAEDPLSLFLYRRDHAAHTPAHLARRRGRAPLSVFNAHADDVITRYNLRDLRVQARATGLTRTRDGLAVETTAGRIESRRVLLAMGVTEQLRLPEWVGELPDGMARHVCAPGFDIAEAPDWRHCVVVGGGMTAAQTAVALSKAGKGVVTLLSRGKLRCHDFDTDIEWIRPAGPVRLAQEPDFDKRRAMIEAGRHPGSVTANVEAALALAVGLGRLTHAIDTVLRAEPTGGGEVRLELATGESLTADRLLIATGFDNRTSGGDWLDAAVDNLGLRTAACGYPVADESLAWGSGVFVAGALAELTIGPAALNIAGARFAGRRFAALTSG
ncbi:MAG: FAD-dependent oxidoreductase [Candidatus Poribacteria bacterium]